MASLSSKLKRQWHVNQRKKETDTIVKSTGSPAPTRLRQIAFASKHPDRERYLLTKVLDTEIVFDNGVMKELGLMNLVVPIGGEFIEVVWPSRPNASGGRFLDKLQTDAAGYLLIMQTHDAGARRTQIERRQHRSGKAVLWDNGNTKRSYAVQYHPKIVPGNIMPELDTMYPTVEWPDMLGEQFAPWHGFPGSYKNYAPAMKRTGHLQLVKLQFRLPPGQDNVLHAARQWRDVFGVPMTGATLIFTNSTMEFLKGETGKREGLESLTIAVQGKEKLDGILQRAKKEGILRGDWVELCGSRWYFIYAGEEKESKI